MSDGAAFRDLGIALARQRRAVCGLVFGSVDPLFGAVSLEDLEHAPTGLSAVAGSVVRCAVVDGARHNAHSIYPHFYRELEAALIRRR